MEPFIKAGQVAKIIGVSRRTISWWAKEDMIPHYVIRLEDKAKKGNKFIRYYFKLSEILEWMEANQDKFLIGD